MANKLSQKYQQERLSEAENPNHANMVVHASVILNELSVVIDEVKTRRQMHQFIHLPAAIHQNHPNWVPPIYMDEKGFFNPKKNKSFHSCDTILLLATRDKEVIGRIMGIIHHSYNADHGEKAGRFAFFETWNEPRVETALLLAVEQWARDGGMEKLIGPLAFSDKDPQGFLIDGFDQPAVISSNCNHAYMVDLMIQNHYSKEKDLVVYQINIPPTIPPFYLKIQERAIRMNASLRVLEFTSRRKVKPYIHPVLHLLNKTFTEIYGFVPFSEAEMDDFAHRYLFLINPRFIKIIVTSNNEVVAFVIGMSHIGEGLQKTKGYLLPFGIFHILRSGRKSKQLNLLLGGIDPCYRGRGLDVMMGVKMLESAKSLGKTILDSHLELEYNTQVRAEMEKLNGKVYKRFRIFQKLLIN